MEKSDLQRFRDECVAAHNFYRAAHGTPPICWSTKLAESAQNWADQLASTTGSLRYSSAKGVGENLACLWGSELNGQKVTRIWYEEVQHFDYYNPCVSSRTRSFAQVVWEGTREFGAGAAVTKYGKQIVVARYFPPMNKKDVARNVKKVRCTRDDEQPLPYDTRWSRLYVGLKEFHEECLSVHNDYRTRHGAAPLHWSAELAWEAQQWAEDLARNGELRHNNDDTVGENLAGMTGGELTGQEAVDMWYEEIESYDFDNHGYSQDTSNFTQVVWVASENLGVGRAVEGDLCVVVAFYEPPGNMEGSFSDNVLRMGSNVRQRKSKEPKGFIPPPPDLEGFRLECLVTHNYFRARHGSPPLVLNSALTDEAQYWAERLLVTGATEGLDNSHIGISVAILDNKHASGIKVSELWYKQISNYDFDSPGFSSETLDFSQLVWTSSRKLGLGKATGAEGVSVVVARYEPVGNIDGMFVQNVKRRGHERGSCEPMIFHVEYKYRVRTDSKSTNSFLSWEHEEGPTLELESDDTKPSDLEQIDENENIVHRTEEPESTSTLTVSDAFTRLVWIDPNSPTLQRKGVTEDRPEEVDHGDVDDEEEDGGDAGKDSDEEKGDSHEMEMEHDEEDARTAYEQENREESEDIDCVSEEPYVHMEEPKLEEADLFSDPEDDLYQRICEVRRSLSLDSEGTEPETQKGNVLSKVAFFETFQRSFEAQSPSNSESSFRRSLIQDELEELASRPKRHSAHEEEEQEEAQQEEEEEHECQLEFDDLFPAHTEGDEADKHDEIFEEEAGEEEESLVSVSDTEDVLDFTDYDTRPEGLQDYQFEDNYHETHEFADDESSTMEIFDFSDEDASHQYADITETEDKPRLSTKRIFTPVSLGASTEFHKTESYRLCEDTTPDPMEDAPESYREELCQTKEAIVEVPRTYFTRTLDPDHIVAVTKRQEIDNQMEELTSKLGLLPVENSAEDSNDLSEFDETTEGKLLQNFIYGNKVKELEGQKTPVEEICEATQRNSVESDFDFDELLTRLERNAADTKKKDLELQTRMDTEEDDSADVVHAIVRDRKSKRSAEMERISSEIGLEFTEQSEVYVLEQQELTPNITLTYECQSLVAADDMETVSEKIEAAERKLKPENAVDLEELQARLESPVEAETPQNKFTRDDSDSSVTEIACEAVLRDHEQERERVIEEIGLVRVSPDIIHSSDEPLEPLPYEQAPTSPQLPEVITESVSVEVRRDARCEINFEELFHRIDEDKDADETAGTQRSNGIQDRVEHYGEEKPCVLVFRDHDQERTRNLEQRSLQLEAVPISAHVIHPQEPIEPLSYDITPQSFPQNRLPEVSEHISVEVRQDVQSEIQFEDMFRRLQESNTMKADEVGNTQGFEETEATVIEKPLPASLYEEENTVVAEVERSAPLCTQHISHESEDDIPAEEVELITLAEQKRPSSLYMEENRVIDEIGFESPSSPKHNACESANLVKTEVVREEGYTDEGESSSQVVDEHQIVTVIHTETLASQDIARETLNIESFHKINSETLNDEDNRASLYMEEHIFIKDATPEVSSSPSHIASECEQITLLEEVEEEIEKREKDTERASLHAEESIFVDASTLEEAPPKTLHVAGETVNIDPATQTQEVVEQFAGEKRVSVFIDEEASVNYVTTDIPSSPFHIAGESVVSESVDEIYEEERGEVVKRASLFSEEDSVINEVVPDTVSSPKHIAAESQNDECFEEIDEQPLEESKRTSMFLEEAMTLGEVITDTQSSPKHLATESKNVETFEEIEEESNVENKRASLFFEETPLTEEVKTAAPPSPKHIAGEIKNVDVFDEVDDEDTEERKRASLFMEEAVTVDEVTANTPSSPKHLAGGSLNVEAFEEVETELEDENKRASVLLEEDSFVDEVKTATSSVSIQIAGYALNVTTEETHEEEDKPNQEQAVEVESDSEATYGSISFETPDERSHIAAEFSSYNLLEVTDDEESPESDHGEHFQNFEGTYGAETLLDPTETTGIAGEIRNKDPHDETVFQGALQVEESLRYDESREKVTTTDLWETPQSLIHIASELSNVEPREESFEEEKAEEKAFAEEYEETEVHASTVVLKSPQSLLSIAAAALEHKIDTTQLGATEDVSIETVEHQYSGEEHRDLKGIVPESFPSSAYLTREFNDSPPDEEAVEVAVTSGDSMNLYEKPETTDVTITDVDTEVPLILVNIASEISDYEDENLVLLDEEPQKVLQSDTQRHEYQEETVCEDLPDEQLVAAEFCASEIVLEEDDRADQRETVEPFEESEGSVSELMSECSSSPFHVSSKLKDFRNYETISETNGSETYHVITYEEDDFIPEKSISKGLPSLFISEGLVMKDVCEKNNILNEQSEVVETAQEFSEVEEPSGTPKILHISEPSSETAAELSDADFSNGVEEEDELSEREFAEEFEDMEGFGEQTVLKDSGRIVSTSVSTIDPEFAEEGDLLDETDNAQKPEVQADVVNIEQLTRDSSPLMLAAVNDRVVDKEEKIVEHVWEVTTEEKQEAPQVQKFTILESKKSFSVSQTNGESVIVGEQGRTMEVSHEIEEKVKIFSTTFVHQLPFTTSHIASEFTRVALEHPFETNGTCTSRQIESSDELSESILDRETKDHELEKHEKQLSEEETEVRLLKSEVMEYRAAELQAPLVSPNVTVERETTLVKTMVVQSSAKEDQEEVIMREDRITAILKDDEASLEEESAGEKFEEEIDIMRMDEALSEEEFRGEGAENIDRSQSRSPTTRSAEEIDKSKEQKDVEVREEDAQKPLYEEEIEIGKGEPFYEEEFEGEVVEVSHEEDESFKLEEHVEISTFQGSHLPVEESLETDEEAAVRTQSSEFEEELEVSALPSDSLVYEECTQEVEQVEQTAVFEEELEISAFPRQDEPVEGQSVSQNEIVDRSAIFEEELEISTYKTQEEVFEEQHIEEKTPIDGTVVIEDVLEVSALPALEEPTEEKCAEGEDHEALPDKKEERKSVDNEEAVEQSDEEESLENVTAQRRRQPLDLSQVDLYDEEESAAAARYYVELSSTESLEPTYEEVEEDEPSYTETYVRQGEPLAENLEEFILVRYGDEFESSGEEDISDHREIYVIPEEENDIENNNVGANRVDVQAEEPQQESSHQEGFEDMGLEDIRESPEFDIDDSDELDEEEQRQLEEYERLESFVILEEKLSQVESDDEENGDLPLEEGDENVFHSDVHSSSEETLHEDELGETMRASSIRQAAVPPGTEDKAEAPQGDNQTHVKDGSDENQETPKERSPETEEPPPVKELSDNREGEELSLVEAGPKFDTEDERLPDLPTEKKDSSELGRTKEDKTEQGLSSDSSGEQGVSSEGSLSSTPSVDFEGLNNFEQDCLLQHNLYRRQHRVKPLKWSEELAEGAKRWAEHLASVNSPESFDGKDVGENLTSVQGHALNGSETADLWYKEATDYNFEDPAFNAKCGRFTQVIWASSREFGVAKCASDDGTEYIVARYKPAGNILGEFKENVKPPRDPPSRLKRRRSSVRRHSKSGAPSTPAEKEKFKTECVISHNYYRTFHSAPPLRWSPLLAAEAQNYAERLAKTDSLTHSGQKDRGENLAYTWDTPLSARGAIEMWYDEAQDYDFENPGFTSDTGHFTQLVWVGTEEFGMGMTVAPDGRNVVVGRYFPPGNVVGQFKENVRPREIDGIP